MNAELETLRVTVSKAQWNHIHGNEFTTQNICGSPTSFIEQNDTVETLHCMKGSAIVEHNDRNIIRFSFFGMYKITKYDL